ncbi:DUF4876 domain-containing protein [Prevotella aurantiaca]|jgi:hypothetical protein|uniref:DUF4876 domain-containing protein n=1 Tax=Prevotella aurantiaca TaxID=596085 RepID=A0A930HLY4_9BACT|nr:DUF4876 domain-containing protein [Prevotella aurantiaca]MBF1384255.1 DUF4876 domain-containing protein [Prevotella aurantiaca]
MTKKILMSTMLLLAICFSFVSCSDDKNDATTTSSAVINLEMPMTIQDGTLHNVKIIFTNKSTAQTYTIEKVEKTANGYTATIENLPIGSYSVVAVGTANFSVDGQQTTTEVKATNENVNIVENQSGNTIKLLFNVFTGKEGFVISEIFFRGTSRDGSSVYNRDQYFKITNNSDQTLYADSIIIMESAFRNDNPQTYLKDLRNDGFATNAIYMIPGNGNDVPVKPGESLLIALNAKDHKAVSSTSFDLSKADFEFYDESKVSIKDEDNPSVKNLDKWYCYTQSFFILNMHGNNAYAIAKIRGTKEDFLKNNTYNAQYYAVNGKLMTTNAYFIPNAWIIDAVNLSYKDNDHQWRVMSILLDKGYTYCSDNKNDKSGIGTAVVRKMANGKYADTNNSTEDFTPKATPTVK